MRSWDKEPSDNTPDIKNFGDKVIIRKIPTIQVFDHVVNADLPIQDVSDESITLNIDKAKGYNFNVTYVDEYQSDIALIEKLTEDASMQMKVAVDQSVLQSVYSDVATANTVGTSIGTTSPLQLSGLTTATYITPLLNAGQVLDANNVPRDGERWAVISPQFANYLKLSDLKQVLITGDDKSPLRNGYVGTIDGMKVYVSNNLLYANGATVSLPTECLVGHPSALAFASQFQKPEMLPNPRTFGTLVRGLNVYGFKTVKPEAMVRVRVY